MAIRKYNLIYLPTTQSSSLTALSRRLETLADTYLLGPRSLPHLTLCQFKAEASELPMLWQRLCASVSIHAISLTLNKSCSVTFDDKLYWISLLPEQQDALFAMRAQALKWVTSSSRKPFDPHVTLINTRVLNHTAEMQQRVEPAIPMSDTFVLALGDCDGVGQVTTIRYRL